MRPWMGHAAASPRAQIVCPSICLLRGEGQWGALDSGIRSRLRSEVEFVAAEDFGKMKAGGLR